MLGYLAQSRLDEEVRKEILREASGRLAERHPDLVVRGLVSEADRAKALEAARLVVAELLARRGLPQAALEDIAREAMALAFGLGWLEPLLDRAARGEVTEIMMNPDGSLWVIPKGAVFPERVPLQVSPEEARIVVDKLLAAVGRRMTEAEPIVSAKIPRSERLPAGARVHVVAPPIANGDYPALNLRFYEARPVTYERVVLEWRMLSEEMAKDLEEAIRGRLRLMIAGGTGTGKTTFLSFLANRIPPENRILLCEDPAEIFLDRPHVVSLEARPPSLEGKYGVSMGDLVTAAMRMTPRWWLVVGEVRRGDAAMWLLRAQMSDHPGLSTIHADSPRAVVDTLGTLLLVDMRVPLQGTKELFIRAVDLVVQIGFDPFGRRRVLEIAEVEPELRGGDVRFRTIWRYVPERSTPDAPVWEKQNAISRRRA